MRPIDADALYEDMLHEMCGTGFQTNALSVIRRAPTISPLPNDPLTLEELREMEGEPVWAMLRLPTNGIKGGWALVDTRHGYAAAQQRWTNWTLWYDEYGKTWTAYRRRPEEGMT